MVNQISNPVTLFNFHMHLTLTQFEHCHEVNASTLSCRGHSVPGDYGRYNLPCFTSQSIFNVVSLGNIALRIWLPKCE